jgi:hypothetical protein
MRITVALGQARGTQRWMRTVLLTAGLALLVSAAPHPVGAEANNPRDAAETQASACELGGGEAHVFVLRDAASGVYHTSVNCTGGDLDGMDCQNDAVNGADCTMPEWWRFQYVLDGWWVSTSEIVGVLESGSEQQITAMMTDLEAAQEGGQAVAPPAQEQGPAAQPSVTSADEQEHEQATTNSKHQKGKKGKHGKKGGKGRK